MKKIVLTIFILTGLIIQNYAFPRFSLRSGGKCIDCHVNPTGGEMRSMGGWLYGKNTLSLYTSDGELSPKIGDNITFGFDYRTQYLTKSTDSTLQSDFQKMEGSIYFNVELSDKINVYARYDFLFSIWEAYGVLNVLPNDGYIKVGTFSPNYGIRLDDHTAYTRGGDLGVLFSTGGRQGLIYDPRYTETGVELGLNFGEFAELTASVGNPRFSVFVTDPTYTARLSFNPVVASKVALLFGGSFASFKDHRINSTTGKVFYANVNMYGGFAGIGLGDFTILGEYDIAEDNFSAGNNSSAMMVEGAYRFSKGFEGVVRYDKFDRNINLPNDDFRRLILGMSVYPYSFIELIPQYRFQWETPEVKNNSFVLQFHLYY